MKKITNLYLLILITIVMSSCNEIYSTQLKTDVLQTIPSINSKTYPLFFSPRSYKKEALFPNTFHILVNTNHYFKSDYKPNDLVNVKDYDVSYIVRDNESILLNRKLMENYKLMYDDMKNLGLDICIYSGYRNYDKQTLIYKYTKEKDEVALPGFSEHQSGLAVDISTINDGLCIYFSYSREFDWLINNSYKYGFILRYPINKTAITGYNYECWHFRYVGEIAHDITNKLTLEEYLYSNYILPA